MNRHLLLVIALTFPERGAAQQTLPWAGPDVTGARVIVHPQLEGDEAVLEVTGQSGIPTITTVVQVAAPKIASHRYHVATLIRYENVEGVGHVEMLSEFPDKLVFLSRATDESGPRAKLKGTSDWRQLVLPFEAKPGQLPTTVRVRVHLAGGGKVFLKPFVFAEGDGANHWWTEPQAGLIGGIGGSAIGLLGATIGVLAGLGRARRVTLGLCWLGVILGVAGLAIGVFALLAGQPWHVYYPLLLGGGITAAVCGFNLPTLKKRYEQIEMRKMTALDG